MSDIILGDMCRLNFGLRKKYDNTLRQDYKTYIDTLEKDMITAIYGNNINNCIITRTYNLNLTEEEMAMGLYSFHAVLAIPLTNFCKLHNVSITIDLLLTELYVTIDMLTVFSNIS